MDKQALIEKLRAIEASPSCYSGLRLVIQDYLKALNTPRERAAAEKLIDELKADVVLVDHMVIFARSKNAVEMFGEAGAKKFAAHADALRKRGDKYCNCLACQYGLEVLKYKDALLS